MSLGNRISTVTSLTLLSQICSLVLFVKPSLLIILLCSSMLRGTAILACNCSREFSSISWLRKSSISNAFNDRTLVTCILERKCAISKRLFRLATCRAHRRAKPNTEVVRNGRPDEGNGAEASIQKASEDRLRRAEFAARIADVLSEPSLREGRATHTVIRYPHSITVSTKRQLTTLLALP